jgi:putative hydrolase of the HAD superfamily
MRWCVDISRGPVMCAEQTSHGLEAVLFDLGGTLDAPGIPWKERLFRLYRAEDVVITPEEFASVFYRADDALVGVVPPALSLRETVERLVDGVSEGLALGDADLTNRISRQFYEGAVTCARGNASLLSELAGRYRLGIVSNFYGNLATVCDEIGFRPYLSVVVDSTQVGWTKPDVRIFGYALDRLGVDPGAAAFVGDSFSRDMAGARAVGMTHVWLAGDTVGSIEPCCPGDRVIRTLETLRSFLL